MFEPISSVHLVGVGGIGMSAAARWLLKQGKKVSGSDMQRSPLAEALVREGLVFHSGHAPGNVPEGAQLLIYSAAVPEDNVERVEAVTRGIPQLVYAEFLGELTKLMSGIVVTGTNGKSTTTALLGLMLEAAGYDPTVIVGTLVPGFGGSNLRVGKGRFLVVEGCEYKGSILQLEPEMAIVTNIEEDHLDYFRDLEHIRETFQTFIDKLKGKGLVVWNADDAVSTQLRISRGVSFGAGRADYQAAGREAQAGSQRVQVVRGDERLGTLTLRIPGAFNVMNALAATAAAMELGVPFETCARVVAEFGGVWRRFERVGVWNEAEIISDYGHHPTSVRATIEAAREFFPERRIVLCFQPHQHSRTKELLEGFATAVLGADHVIIPEIYKVTGRTEVEEKEISSHDLVARALALNGTKDIRYAKDLDQAESLLREIVKPGDVVMIQGAGDVDDLARKIAL